MNPISSGLIGAAALTTIHETARRLVADPPRMDVVGMRGLERVYHLAGAAPPAPRQLFAMTLLGDIVSNALYYAAVGRGTRKSIWTRAVALGVGAGVGAVVLPRRLGLGDPPHNERLRTRILTLAYYVAGALAAAAAADYGRTGAATAGT